MGRLRARRSAAQLWFNALSPLMPDLRSFARRACEAEVMDDFGVDDALLERTLYELRYVNKYLGGRRALRRVMEPVLRSWTGGTFRVLDLGTGLGDHAEAMLHAALRYGVRMHVTAVDANPSTIGFARTYLDSRLEHDQRSSVDLVVGDVREELFPTRSFHVVTASLLLHHFDDEEAVALLRRMSRTSELGLVVNDLHRHVLAYAGIRTLASVLPVSSIFRHDGPLSVRRAFMPAELTDLARQADLEDVEVARHWAFRLTLSTLTAAGRMP